MLCLVLKRERKTKRRERTKKIILPMKMKGKKLSQNKNLGNFLFIHFQLKKNGKIGLFKDL